MWSTLQPMRRATSRGLSVSRPGKSRLANGGWGIWFAGATDFSIERAACAAGRVAGNGARTGTILLARDFLEQEGRDFLVRWDFMAGCGVGGLQGEIGF